MPHVSVRYKIYLPAGHHRQPRNASAQLEPNPPSEVDVQTPGNITPLYIPQLPFTLNGNAGLAQLLFWSVTDGTEGHTYPAGPLTQAVGSSPLTVTAWYYPTGGVGGTGGPAIIDDAFSAIKGDFIDDTFVNVTSDPSLNDQANVVGVLSTAKALTLVAKTSVTSTPEPFAKWLSYSAGSASGSTLNVPVGANGVAIAVYEETQIDIRPPHIDEAIGGTVIGGVAVDGGGAVIVNGKPHPVDPWGPLVVALAQASLVTAGSRALDRASAESVQQVTAQSVIGSLKQAITIIEKTLARKR